MIDRAEYRCRVVFVDKRTRAIVDRFTRNCYVVGVHDSVHKANTHPFSDKQGLSFSHCAEKFEIGIVGRLHFRVMAGNRIVGQLCNFIAFFTISEKLKSTNAYMAGRNTGKYRTRKRFVAHNLLAGCNRCQCTRCWDIKQVHRLTDNILTQYRRKCSFAVATAGKRRRARTFELNILAVSIFINYLAKQ